MKAKWKELLSLIIFPALAYFLAPQPFAAGSYSLKILERGQTIVEVPLTIDYGVTTHEISILPLESKESLSLVREFNPSLGKEFKAELRMPEENSKSLTLEIHDRTGIRTTIRSKQERPDTVEFEGRLLHEPGIVLAGVVLVALLWVTELIPIAATSLLIPIMVSLFGLDHLKPVLAQFAHPIIFLFLGGFLLARGMQKAQIDKKIAEYVVSRISRKGKSVVLVFMVLSAFLSMWMSNTASVAIMIPIALALVASRPDLAGIEKTAILGVAWAGSMGGIGSAIGTPANMLAIAMLNEYGGQSLKFADWFKFGLPMVFLMIPIIWVYLSYFTRFDRAGEIRYSTESKSDSKKSTNLVMLTFVTTVGLWLTESIHGIPSSISALIGAFMLFVFQVLDKRDLNHINWNALLTFGGGLAMGRLLVTSGLSYWLAEQLAVLQALPEILVILAISLLTVTLGAFISNTACAAMIIPVAIPLAELLGIDLVVLAGLVAVASSIDFAFVVGTPPTMLAYSTGAFSTKEIFRIGIKLNLIAILILNFVVIPIWSFLV